MNSEQTIGMTSISNGTMVSEEPYACATTPH